ncbi:sensor histidine kinase [Hymenobacter bucti]|uniref:histidine kinase n=1 Tax=Hymenobacter bucti TaxID=1844114 RepID=A0ABW4QQL3_9BACT
MTRRIKLLVALMAGCTLALLGLQAYWNYQAYQQALRSFRRDANEALADATRQEIRLRQEALLQRCRIWLADTNQFVIRARVDKKEGYTIFSLADKHPAPTEKRLPYDIGFQDFHLKTKRLDTDGRAFFIKRFTAGAVADNVREGLAYFYTRALGERLHAAFRADTVHTRRLGQLYARALRQRDIPTPFRLVLARQSADSKELVFATSSFNTSAFGRKDMLLRAWFPNPQRVYLRRMQGVLLGSVGLIGIVMFCFAYTVQSLLSQERLAALKDDFVSNMTHELKTPVATIGVAAEALEQFDLGPKASAEYLGIIRQQAGRLGALIDQILQSAVAEQAGPPLARRPLDLGPLLTHALTQIQPQLTQAGSPLVYDAPPAALPIVGDAIHLTNVLMTLFDNALKHGRLGGKIRLWSGVHGGAAVVQLINEGPIIPPQYLGRVFEKFFRVPTGNRHDVPGYGLGLHYAQTVVRHHGGTIAVRSQDGRTTFTITIPLAPHVALTPVAALEG